jgi:hypothetical protein
VQDGGEAPRGRVQRLGRLGALSGTVIAVILLPLATNVATSAIPEQWRPYLWIAWPLAALLAVSVIVGEVRTRGAASAAGSNTAVPRSNNLAGPEGASHKTPDVAPTATPAVVPAETPTGGLAWTIRPYDP